MQLRVLPGAPEVERREPQTAAPLRRAASVTPEGVLALQPFVGNAVLARAVLARTKAEHVNDLKIARTSVQGLEDTVSGLLAKEKELNALWADAQPPVYLRLEVGKVEKLVAEIKPLMDDVEAERDPDNALKAVGKKLSLAKKELENLESLYGKETVKSERVKVAGERAAREEKERKTLEQEQYATRRRQEEEQKETAEATAEQQRQTQMQALGITPNTTGAAYSRPQGQPARQRLLTYVQLRHRPFANLTITEINRTTCFLYHLTLEQIERIVGYLGTRTVTAWSIQGIPNSRQDSGLAGPLVMPNTVSGLTPEIGAEIFIDWATGRPRHASSIDRIGESFNFTAGASFAQYGTRQQTGATGNIAYVYNSTGKRLVTNHNRTAIITYFDGN